MTTEYSGTGDPARSLALLWRTTERGTRRGRTDLTVDRIVRAAIDLADTHGLATLTMRRVAEHLGVGTMSLYTHIPGKGELLDVMLDTVYAETTHPPHPTPHWRQGLEHIARDNLALYLRHPWLLQVATTRPPLGPHLIAKYDHELRVLDGIGLTDHEMDATLTLVLGFVHGCARGAVDAAQATQHTGLTDQQWWHAHAPYLDRALDSTRYPLATRVGTTVGETHQGPTDPAHAFTFGLHRILDGIDTLIRHRG
jgi:AcrR family transcriptional regulator